MRAVFLVVIAFVAFVSVPAAAQAADPGNGLALAQVESATAASAQQAPAGQPGIGLPERAAAPRTMRAYWHVFGAFAVTWALLFGFALSIGRRFGRLEDEVQRLRGS
jgi:CcmD family protein